jgi:hypothetical protein
MGGRGGGAAGQKLMGLAKARRRVYCTERRVGSFGHGQRGAQRGHLAPAKSVLLTGGCPEGLPVSGPCAGVGFLFFGWSKIDKPAVI